MTLFLCGVGILAVLSEALDCLLEDLEARRDRLNPP